MCREKFHKKGRAFVGLVHRLDQPVSGVMVFARTSKAASRLSDQFKKHSVDKSYICVVNGKFALPEAVLYHETREKFFNGQLRLQLENRLVIEGNCHVNVDQIQALYTRNLDRKPMILSYRVLHELDWTHFDYGSNNAHRIPQSLVAVSLYTGRKHQIRAQLSELGHPIVGDTRHGAPQRFGDRSIALHAGRLEFRHIVANRMVRLHMVRIS